MFQLLDAAPERELEIGGGTGGNEFDGRSLRLRIGELREENGGVIRASEVLPQPESIVDHLTFGLIPNIAHVAPPTASTCEPAEGDTPKSATRDGERAPRRLRQGWNVSTCDSQAPGAGRSSPTFWHETGWKGSVVSVGYGEASGVRAEGALRKRPGSKLRRRRCRRGGNRAKFSYGCPRNEGA